MSSIYWYHTLFPAYCRTPYYIYFGLLVINMGTDNISTEIFSNPYQIVNRIQKLRKKAALEPTDMMEAYFESLDQDKSVSQRVLHSQVLFLYIRVMHSHLSVTFSLM